MNPRNSLVLLAAILTLSGCGVRDKIEQRINEEVAEKIVEVAAGGELDVETKDGKVTIEGKDGTKIESDPDAGTVVVTNSDGTRAVAAQELPSDFPIALPELQSVVTSERIEAPDGGKSMTVLAVAKSTDLPAVATDLVTQLEGKGLEVTRTDIATGEGAMVTLAGKTEDGKLEANCVLSSSADAERPGTNVMISWIDRSAVAPG